MVDNQDVTGKYEAENPQIPNPNSSPSQPNINGQPISNQYNSSGIQNNDISNSPNQNGYVNNVADQNPAFAPYDTGIPVQNYNNSGQYQQNPYNQNYQHSPYSQNNQVHYQNDFRQPNGYMNPPSQFDADLFARSVERRHIKRLANGQGLALFFQFGLTVVMMFIGVFVLSFQMLADDVMEIYEIIDNYFPHILFLLALTLTIANTIPAIVFLKRKKFKVKDIFINSSSHLDTVLKPKSIFTLCVFAVGVNGICEFIGMLYSLLLGDGFASIDNNNAINNIFEFFEIKSGVNMLLIFTILSIVAPITEELLLRGAFLQPLRRYGDKYAIIISSVMFGLIHGNFSQSIFAGLLGLLIGYVTTKSNSIIPGIIIHFANNTFAFLTIFIESEYQFIVYIILGICAIYALFKTVTYKKWISFENEFAIEPNYIPRNKYAAYFSSPAIVINIIFYLGAIIFLLVNA